MVGVDLLYLDEVITLFAKAELFGIVEQMLRTACFYALYEMLFAMVGRLAYGIDACAVDNYGVERGEYAEFGEFGQSRVAVAVAVDRQVVGHVDVDYFVADMVYDGLAGFSH